MATSNIQPVGNRYMFMRSLNIPCAHRCMTYTIQDNEINDPKTFAEKQIDEFIVYNEKLDLKNVIAFKYIPAQIEIYLKPTIDDSVTLTAFDNSDGSYKIVPNYF